MIQSKLPNVGTTIFTRMSALAAQHGALNLSQGFPDFDGPLAMREALVKHVMDGHNQYAPMAGVLALREQIAVQFDINRQIKCDPGDEITVTPGATRHWQRPRAACTALAPLRRATQPPYMYVEYAYFYKYGTTWCFLTRSTAGRFLQLQLSNR